MNISAVILAGGESRRMGRDKAWLEIDGQPLIQRALKQALEAGSREIFISGRPGTDYSRLGCPVLFDLEPGLGPLSGIERGLAAASSPLVLVLAVDLPNMSVDLLKKLAGKCDPLTGVVPKLNGAYEPLAAIYPKRCHAIAVDLQTRFCSVAREFATSCLRERAVRSYAVAPQEAGCFRNWNSAADWADQTDRSDRSGQSDQHA